MHTVTAFSGQGNIDSITAALEQIFREVLGEPDLQIADDLSPETLPAWDSLAHIGILFSIESAFGIRFTDKEMAELQDVRALRHAVSQRTEPQG